MEPGLSVRCPVTTEAQTSRCHDVGCTATYCRSLGVRTGVIAGRHERGIVYLDCILRGVDHAEAGPFKEGWEIHVRRPDGDLDVLYLARRSARGAKKSTRPVSKFPWNLRCEAESWGDFANVGDALMQALEPMASGDPL